MRSVKGLAVGLVTVGLVGCGGSGASTPSAAARSGRPAAAPGIVASTVPAPTPVSPRVRAGARAAAAQFYGLYSARQFATSWDLLSPVTKRQVSKRLWVSVHDACQSRRTGKSRTIRAVTVFGSAAIVTEAITGASPGTTEDVFNYSNGRWSYSPADLSIYHHGSVAADVAAARAAGFCASGKLF